MQLTNKQHIYVYTLTLCATLFFVFPLTTHAQTLNIPDANLRAAIEEALGKTPNARITAEEMAILRELRAVSMDIRNLAGLEAAVNLEDLRLDNNSISDISPLAGLIKLRHIELEENEITDLSPLEGLIGVEQLRLGTNLISDLSPLEGLINLRGITLHHNAISDLSPLGGLMKLEWIGMSHNPVADLTPLSGLTNLHNYHSWGTPVLNLSAIAKLPKLREINVCGGEISDISALADAKSLKELYLPGNEVSDLSPLKGLTSLTHLSLEHNEISDLSPLEGLSNLTWADFRDNKISDVSPLAASRQLRWLDLSQNSAITDVSALAVLPNLTWMGLAENTRIESAQLERFSTETTILHANFVNSTFPEAGPKIVGPWLWAIVPGSGVSNADLLAKATEGAATEIKVSTFGATEDKPVGDSKWVVHNLSAVGGDNINKMTDALGWGSGSEVYDHVVYGSLTLNSPRKQETTMLVGSDDGVKVWLNGEVVHYNPVERGAGDFQDAFPVTLKQGPNVLLVALDNRGHGAFSGFFGFAKDTEYTVNHPDKKIVIEVSPYDVNKDGITNILDLILVGQNFGKTNPTNARADVNGDGAVNISDLVLVAGHLGELSGISAAPSVLALHNIGLDSATIQAWIAQAQVENDGSLVFQRGITNLQQLLALLTPEKTALLANYPNPFNPETWIPYQLSQKSDVQVRIYTTNGALVRTLDLGHQPAGVYQQRARAAYWDGRNQLGESVASGVYFYTLTTGDFTATRKMLIAK
ncbi:MAG: leucine-rich repeat domain-containing protein [Candidatus Poribacteria bacterium]|nr:leucine-rich repeat domain-containing protein [Candidatus Poribacteria bacterium]